MSIGKFILLSVRRECVEKHAKEVTLDEVESEEEGSDDEASDQMSDSEEDQPAGKMDD